MITCFQFAEEFRDQFTAERLEYMDEIEDAIRNSVDERYRKGQGPSGVDNGVSFGVATFRLDAAICRFCQGSSD